MVSISVGSALWKLRFLLDGATRIYLSERSLPLSFPISYPLFVLLPPAPPRDRYYFQAARRGLLKARGWMGALAWGGSGVLQREIPSITPWASYIRDYFSFLSPFPPCRPPSLFLSISILLSLSLSFSSLSCSLSFSLFLPFSFLLHLTFFPLTALCWRASRFPTGEVEGEF